MSNDTDRRIIRAEKLTEHLMTEMETYHSHKETMAHAALLVMLTLYGSILLRKEWPPKWVPELSLVLSPRYTAFIGLVIIWLLLHVYIRWQLRNRRSAAITQAGAFRAFVEWVIREPTKNDLKLYSEPNAPQGNITAKWVKFLDFIIPFPQATLDKDIEKTDFPK